MTTVLNSGAILSPGAYVSESVAGFVPAELADFSRLYMIGHGTTGDKNVAKQVLSTADFVNQFGTSGSEASVDLYFANNPGGVLFYVRTGIAARKKLTVNTATIGTYNITINGTTVSYEAQSGDTNSVIANGIVGVITGNSILGSKVTAVIGSTSNTVSIKSRNPLDTLTVTASAGVMTVVDDTPITPTRDDYVTAGSTFYEDEMPQGFVAAPEAFQTLTDINDRVAFQTALEAVCATYDLMLLVDSGPTNQVGNAEAARLEGTKYTSERGHTSYHTPHIKDTKGRDVPLSAGLAGLAIRRYKAQGIQQPPAGSEYRLRGATDVMFKITKAERDVLNPLGINVVRNKFNDGIVVWGARTRSSNPYYRFFNTRIVLNVFNRTVQAACERLIFEAITPQLFIRVKSTITEIAYRFYRAGAFYGATVSDAFEVVCDQRNNPAIDLESGIVRADAYVVPSPTCERLLIGTVRVPIGQISQVVPPPVSSGQGALSDVTGNPQSNGQEVITN